MNAFTSRNESIEISITYNTKASKLVIVDVLCLAKGNYETSLLPKTVITKNCKSMLIINIWYSEISKFEVE